MFTPDLMACRPAAHNTMQSIMPCTSLFLCRHLHSCFIPPSFARILCHSCIARCASVILYWESDPEGALSPTLCCRLTTACPEGRRTRACMCHPPSGKAWCTSSRACYIITVSGRALQRCCDKPHLLTTGHVARHFRWLASAANHNKSSGP